MAIPKYTGTIPSRTQSQTAFDANVQDFLDYFGGTTSTDVIPEINSTAEDIDADANRAENAAASFNATVYSNSTTYNYPDTVIGTDGQSYRCLGTSVLGDDPVTSSTGNWLRITYTNITQQSVVAGTYLTGNIFGLELSKTAANEVTVGKGTCFDSTNTKEMELAANTAVSVPTTINTINHIFITETGGTIAIQDDTDVDGVNLTFDYARWLGFVRTNAAGAIMDFRMSGDTYAFMRPSETTVVSGFTTATFTLVDVSGMVPISRITEIYAGVTSSPSDNSNVHFSTDGTYAMAHLYTNHGISDTAVPWGFGSNGFALRQIPIINGVLYAKISTGSADIGVAQVLLKR